MPELRKNINGFTGTSDFNALDFVIQSVIKGLVNTAIPVRVDAIERPANEGGAAYLSATPLICQRDAEGNALPSVSIPKLRWFRLQHGSAAILCDPKPGDIGLAVFAQQDVSTLTGGNQPVQPGSFRCFDMSDGFYFGGFWGQPPTTFIRIEDTGDITITAPNSVTVNTKNATVNAETKCTVNAPSSEFSGDVKVGGNLEIVGNTTSANGDISAGGVSLRNHVHGGVESGGSNTGTPV